MQLKPSWFDEWVIPDICNWHLKEGAPDWVKKEWDEFIKHKKVIEFGDKKIIEK